MTLGDRVAVMRLGVLQQLDTPPELYANPRNIFVAGFIGSPAMNFFGGQIVDGRVRLPFGEAPVPRGVQGGGEVIVGVRPEDFEDARFSPQGHEGLTFEAPIEVVESMGSETYAYFKFEGGKVDSAELAEDLGIAETPSASGGTDSAAVARLNPESDVREGGRACLWMDAGKLHLFDPHDGSNLALSSR